jgi:hypothetical protein
VVKLTFIELHVDEATMTANAPFSSGSDEMVSDTAGADDTGEATDSGGGLPLVGLGLLVAVVLAVAVWVLGDDETETPE